MLSHGRSTTNLEEMSQLCYEFHSEFYSKLLHNDENLRLMESTLDMVPQKVMVAMNKQLCAPIEIEELE